MSAAEASGSAPAAPHGAARLLPALVFALAAALYGLNGTDGELFRDDAVYAYAGQQLARGVPPYVSTFEAKLPLSALLAGGGALLADTLGADDLQVIRAVFFLVSVLTAVAVYALASVLLCSRAAGLVSALVFIGFWGFGYHALAGPRPKAPLVLFETLSLLLAVQRRWFGAALCASLAFLVWQPMAAYVLASLGLAALQPAVDRSRWSSMLRAMAGAALPVALLVALFAWLGGLGALVEDTLLFNLFHLDRPPASWSSRLLAPLRAVEMGYTGARLEVYAGLLTLLALYAWRLARAGGNPLRVLTRDRFAALLVTFPAPVVWSLLDFQFYPDFYVFLPYAAVGCGVLVEAAGRLLSARAGAAPLIQRALLLGVCVWLVVSAGFEYRARRDPLLPEQRRWAARVEELAGPDGRIVSLGVPQALVLLRRTNPNPYPFICCGMEGWIDAKTPGGFDAFLAGIAREQPDVILFERVQSPVARRLRVWLEGPYRIVRVGRWVAHVRER